MRLSALVATLAVPVGTLTLLSPTSPSHAAAWESRVVVRVVDDDRAQCPGAAYSTIQAAVDTAVAGDIVRVCPGTYAEHVTVRTPIRLLGQPDAVDAYDCFADDPAPVDPAVQAILRPPDDGLDDLLTLEAGGTRVSGLVLQDTLGSYADSLALAAVRTATTGSGYRIDHNLIRNSELGVDLSSDGGIKTRVDHNCLRDNRWAVAGQQGGFSNGRIDHNQTFRSQVHAYEFGWTPAAMRSVLVDSNRSRQDATAFRLENTSAITVAGNTVESPSTYAVESLGGNSRTVLSGNRITGGLAGIVFTSPDPATAEHPRLPVSDAAVVEGNTVSGQAASGIVFVFQPIPAGIVHGAVVEGNVATGNGGSGISVNAGATEVVVRGNTARENTTGLRAGPGSTGVSFTANTASGNRGYDAYDAGTGNSWTANRCATWWSASGDPLCPPVP